MALLNGARIQGCPEPWYRSHVAITDPTLLWLWCRPAAVAPIPHLAWELLRAAGVALEKQNPNKQIVPLSPQFLLKWHRDHLLH